MGTSKNSRLSLASSDHPDLTTFPPFDHEALYQLYRLYSADLLSEDQFFEYVRRGASCWVRDRYFTRVSMVICEDLLQAVLLSFWTVLSGKKPSVLLGSGAFLGYLKKVFDGAVQRTFDSSYDDASKMEEPNLYFRERSPRFPLPYDVEDAIFVEELPRSLALDISSSLRFGGKAREASVYVFRRLLHGKAVLPIWLSRAYEISEPEFFIDHVKVCIRRHLYDARKLLSSRPRAPALWSFEAGQLTSFDGIGFGMCLAEDGGDD